MNFSKFKIQIYADGADLDNIKKLAQEDWVSGLTTNPTLMRQAGVTDYRSFALDALRVSNGKPISFEVFSDDLDEMVVQALEINAWGENIYVKVPAMNTQGISTGPVIQTLSSKGVKLNITAVFTLDQVQEILKNLDSQTPTIISIFAGRIADAGQDPVPVMKKAKEMIELHENYKLLWASPREILNLVQADECACDIITMTPALLKKAQGLGKDLNEFSRETVQMFYDDAQKAGYQISPSEQTSNASIST